MSSDDHAQAMEEYRRRRRLIMSERPIIIPLGGFLGSGKTTLILAAARVLKSRGMRAAAILNDQGQTWLIPNSSAPTESQPIRLPAGVSVAAFRS